MVKSYLNGDDFVKDNSSFLDENKFLSSFFYLDAPLLKEPNADNYALKASDGNKQLLALKVEPYNFMFYGDSELLEELLQYIKQNNLNTNDVICAIDIGDKLIALAPPILSKEYYLHIGMDFMKADTISEPSSDEVEHATLDDVDEIEECLKNFYADCGLSDRPIREKIINNIDTFRIIRKDHKIIALSKSAQDTEISRRVSTVYTRPEYRNMGYARKVTNTIKNEIIESGLIATLHVDQANPISNHLYTSLGFKRVFSKGIYLLK